MAGAVHDSVAWRTSAPGVVKPVGVPGRARVLPENPVAPPPPASLSVVSVKLYIWPSPSPVTTQAVAEVRQTAWPPGTVATT